jgi:hypothetical protein
MKAIQKAEQANLRQALQIKIGDQFCLTYAGVVNEELPTRFVNLLACLERIEINGSSIKQIKHLIPCLNGGSHDS